MVVRRPLVLGTGGSAQELPVGDTLPVDAGGTVTLFAQTTPATVTNTAAATSSIGAGVGSLTLPAGFWVPGRTVTVAGGGVYSTPLSSGITTRVRLGSDVIAVSNTNAALNMQTNAMWSFQVVVTCTAVASGVGSFFCTGVLLFYIGATSPAGSMVNTGAVAASSGVTTAKQLDVTNQWDAASTSRSVTTTNALVTAA